MKSVLLVLCLSHYSLFANIGPSGFYAFPNEYFVETGTLGGDGLEKAKRAGFMELRSIEFDKGNVAYCKQRFKNDPNIIIAEGDSSKDLFALISDIEKPITFWLDAHIYPPRADGGKNCPILEELEQISWHAIKTHTILIDDMHCCGTASFDYLVQDDLIRKILTINPLYEISYVAGGDDGEYPNNVMVATMKSLKSDVWEPTEFVWNLGIAAASDRGIDPNPIRYFLEGEHFRKEHYLGIKRGDVVFIRCRFIKQLLSAIKQPIVVVISDGDESFPSNCDPEFDVAAFLEDDRILHVFAQNCDYKGPSEKVSHIPIGIDFHTIAYKAGGWGERGSPKEQEALLKGLLQTFKPTHLRKKRAFVDFQHSNTMRGEHNRYQEFGEDRISIFNRLALTGLIDYAGRMKRSQLWRTKGQYAFSISPPGNGLDCHRTWEDLALGCIVIVKTSPIDPLYEGLPVVIVNDWSEVTEENMDLWIKQYGDAFENPHYRERLTNEYWVKKIGSYVFSSHILQ